MMSSIYSISSNNNTLSLFNSLSANSTSSSSSSSTMFNIDFAEYASVSSGCYRKLVKAYFTKYGNDASTTVNQETTAKNTSIKSNAKDLYDDASALVTTGKKSLFNKKTVTNSETGETTEEYDKDKIYSAVNDLVDSYNKFVKGSTDSTNNAVLRKTLNMVNSALSNSSLLNDVGISIGSDNTLSIDEEKFKNADMATVKTLFNGTGSFGSKIQSAASMVYASINNSFGNSNLYTSSGLSSSYSTGSLLDTLV